MINVMGGSQMKMIDEMLWGVVVYCRSEVDPVEDGAPSFAILSQSEPFGRVDASPHEALGDITAVVHG